MTGTTQAALAQGRLVMEASSLLAPKNVAPADSCSQASAQVLMVASSITPARGTRRRNDSLAGTQKRAVPTPGTSSGSRNARLLPGA